MKKEAAKVSHQEQIGMKDEDKIKLFSDIMKIPSVNDREEEVAKVLEGPLKKAGFETKLVEYSKGRSNLVATLTKGEGKTLVYTGHLDVVSPGNEEEWSHKPFDAEVVDDVLYGRGASDMKSGVAAMTIAAIELAKEDFKGTLKLLFTVGEEVGELGAQQLTEMGEMDGVNAVLIGEPIGPMIAFTHKGSMNYTVSSKGKEAHSSMPKEGINAIDPLAKYILKANDAMAKVVADYENPELGRTIHNVTLIKGGSQVNSIPGSAQLSGNIRSIPEFPNDKIEAFLQEIVDELNKEEGVDLTLTMDFNKIPVKGEKDSELIEAIQKQFEKPLPVGGISPTTDAAEFTKAKNSFDVAVFGPGDPTAPHKVDERIELANYLEYTIHFKNIAKNYLK